MLHRNMFDIPIGGARRSPDGALERAQERVVAWRPQAKAGDLHVVLDISRLLSSAFRGYPSGIDRVEFAYARRWRRAPDAACSFVARTPLGGFALLPREVAAGLLDALGGAIAEGVEGGPAHWAARVQAVALNARLATGIGRAALLRRIRDRPGSVFLLVSHKSLELSGPIQAVKDAGASFVPLIHDLIPISHPEYNRPRQTSAHRRRMLVTAAMADAVIVNSAATGAALTHYLLELGRPPPRIVVAPLGFDLPPAEKIPPAPKGETPYFVMLGNIEPRKNHQMILSVWRDLAETIGPGAPRLVILGRRGWENEAVFRMLDRSGGFGGLVDERGAVGDGVVASVLSGARALLFPSFAEGYGIPLVEALSLGVPAICSDIPALVEVGAGVPDHLHPLDGTAWRRAVLDYASDRSPTRAAQITRLQSWQRPDWSAHFGITDPLLGHLAAEPRGSIRPARVPSSSSAPAGSQVAGAHPAVR